MSLIAFNKETVVKTVQELEALEGKKIQGSELSNKLENFKRSEEELKEHTEKLLPIRVSCPSFEFSSAEFEKALKGISSV